MALENKLGLTSSADLAREEERMCLPITLKTKNYIKKIDLEINKAGNKSSTICDVCGKQGSLRADLPWMKTLCDDHYNKKQQG